MIKIDKKETIRTAEEHLKYVTKYIQATNYIVEKVPISDITEKSQLKDLIKSNTSTKTDLMIMNDLDIISRLSLESKRILFCVHFLGIKRRNLSSGEEPYEYSFGRPYELYRKAVYDFAVTQEQFIHYKN